MAFNIHNVVRGAIQSINPDTPGTVYLSTGATNVRGILTPTFATVAASLQVQAEKHDPLRHQNNVEYNNSYLTVYAYGTFDDLSRPDNKGGDIINIASGVWAGYWYIYQVLEWWPGWCCFEVVQQLNATSIANLLTQLANGATPT